MALVYKQLRVENVNGKIDLKKRQERLTELGADGWKLISTVNVGEENVDTLAKPAEQAAYPQA